MATGACVPDEPDFDFHQREFPFDLSVIPNHLVSKKRSINMSVGDSKNRNRI